MKPVWARKKIIHAYCTGGFPLEIRKSKGPNYGVVRKGGIMIEYKIYTEDYPNLEEIAAKHLESYSLFRGASSWDGKQELCACFIVYASPGSLLEVCIEYLVRDIKQINKQEAVLVIKHHVESALL